VSSTCCITPGGPPASDCALDPELDELDPAPEELEALDPAPEPDEPPLDELELVPPLEPDPELDELEVELELEPEEPRPELEPELEAAPELEVCPEPEPPAPASSPIDVAGVVVVPHAASAAPTVINADIDT
jgi:hypothetical protein